MPLKKAKSKRKKRQKTGKLQEQERLLKLARSLHEKINKLKLLYGELDEVTIRLQGMGFRSDDFYGIYLKDNFKFNNVAFRTTSVKRFELEFE